MIRYGHVFLIALRFDLMQSAHLKCIIQWFFRIIQVFWNTYSLSNPMPTQPLSNPLWTAINLLYGFAYLKHFTEVESHNMWLFVTNFFHLTQCFQGSPIL